MIYQRPLVVLVSRKNSRAKVIRGSNLVPDTEVHINPYATLIGSTRIAACYMLPISNESMREVFYSLHSCRIVLLECKKQFSTAEMLACVISWYRIHSWPLSTRAAETPQNTLSLLTTTHLPLPLLINCIATLKIDSILSRTKIKQWNKIWILKIRK